MDLKNNMKEYSVRLSLFLLVAIVVMCCGSAGAEIVPSRPQEEGSDSTATTDRGTDTTQIAPVLPDTTTAQEERPDTTIRSGMPADTTSLPEVSIDTTRMDLHPPDTSSIGETVPDTLAIPEDTTHIPPVPTDTATIDMAEPDTTGMRPSEVDSTAFSPADTMFEKVYAASVGETMFKTERISPLSASYTYRYAGLTSDTTYGVELVTKIMQRTYRSHFLFSREEVDSVAIGPYDVRIESLDSTSIIFELKGYTQVPEPEIPEPKEEVAEAVAPSDAELLARVTSQIEELPKSPKEYYSRAYVGATDGNYDEATKNLQTALEMDSSFFEARLLLGWILMEQDSNEAVESFRECNELKPDNLTASFFLAYSLEKFESSDDEAFDTYTSITEADSTNSQALFRLASLYQVRDDSVKASELFEKARGFQPDMDSVSATPSLSEIPHQFWWAEEMPQLVHYEIPEYPETAEKESLECDVIVHVLVDEEGHPAEVKTDQSCGDVRFNETAEAAARKCTFKPGTYKGEPVQVWISVPFRFELPEEEVELAAFQKESELDSLELDKVTEGVTQPDTGKVSSPVPRPKSPADSLQGTEEMPQLDHLEVPEYPETAKEANLECEVSLSILVDEAGRAAQVKIAKPCGEVGFNEAAEIAARKCTFIPGKQQGKPTRKWISLVFSFEFEKGEGKVVGTLKSHKPGIPAPDMAVPMRKAPFAAKETRPHVIQSVPPQYPPQALKDSIDTTVILNVLVGRTGLVMEVEFTQPDTLNKGFNEAAEAAARQYRFRPGMREGIPDTMWVELPVTFSLTLPPTTPQISPGTKQGVPTGAEKRAPPVRPEIQDKAAAYVQATMLAQQGKHDEALEIAKKNLKSDPKDNNSQLLYGLITLAQETGKRLDEVASFTEGTDGGLYWWVDSMPRIKELNEATYPDAAKESKAEGTVLLYVLVDERGSVQKVSVVVPLEEPSLNAAAEEAAKGCTFTPGTLQGQPVKVWTRLPYEFKFDR